jgi:hypothetical protein
LRRHVLFIVGVEQHLDTELNVVVELLLLFFPGWNCATIDLVWILLFLFLLALLFGIILAIIRNNVRHNVVLESVKVLKTTWEQGLVLGFILLLLPFGRLVLWLHH